MTAAANEHLLDKIPKADYERFGIRVGDKDNIVGAEFVELIF